jgi:hypothetical protein
MKNPILISTAYIKELLEDPSIELIEVWDKILYVRMKQGSGKNKFISKKGLTFNLSVYYYESNYRKISSRYHPDRETKKISKQRTLTSLCQNINISREAISGLFEGRRSNAINFVRSNEEFTRFTTIESNTKRSKSLEQIDEEIHQAGYDDYELFGEYCSNPLQDKVWDDQLTDDEEKIIQEVMQVWAESSKRDTKIRRAQTWSIINEHTNRLERIKTYLSFRESRLIFWDPIREHYAQAYDNFRQRHFKSL